MTGYHRFVVHDERLQRLAELLRTARPAVAFTGAGVSTASGLSTFRAQDGIWARFPIEEYGTAEAFQRDPERAWELFGAIEGEFEAARPNPAHQALAELEAMNLLEGVITQNIDGLHQRAGSQRVVEYHGTAETAHCPRCQRRFGRDALPPWPPAPRCPRCGVVVRPDVVLFGDPIPAEASREAEALLGHAGTVLVVGSTLEVMPASWLVVAASRRGSRIAVVDPKPSRVARELAELVIPRPAEEALPELVDLLQREAVS